MPCYCNSCNIDRKDVIVETFGDHCGTDQLPITTSNYVFLFPHSMNADNSSSLLNNGDVAPGSANEPEPDPLSPAFLEWLRRLFRTVPEDERENVENYILEMVRNRAEEIDKNS